MRLRDHVLNMAEGEALDLLEKMGISREERVVSATITAKAPNIFTFLVKRKTGGYGVPIEIEDFQWESTSVELLNALIEHLGVQKGERVLEIVINFEANGLPIVTIKKIADDRLLDLDWPLVAKGAK